MSRVSNFGWSVNAAKLMTSSSVLPSAELQLRGETPGLYKWQCSNHHTSWPCPFLKTPLATSAHAKNAPQTWRIPAQRKHSHKFHLLLLLLMNWPFFYSCTRQPNPLANSKGHGRKMTHREKFGFSVLLKGTSACELDEGYKQANNCVSDCTQGYNPNSKLAHCIKSYSVIKTEFAYFYVIHFMNTNIKGHHWKVQPFTWRDGQRFTILWHRWLYKGYDYTGSGTVFKTTNTAVQPSWNRVPRSTFF